MSSAFGMVLMVALAVPGNEPEKVSGEVEQRLDLSGEWEGTYQVAQVYKVPAGIRNDRLWRDGRGACRRNGVIVGVPYVLLDEGKGNLRLKWHGFHYIGIYRQDGDTVLICFREYFRGRPTEFRSGSEQHLFTFHRVKPLK